MKYALHIKTAMQTMMINTKNPFQNIKQGLSVWKWGMGVFLVLTMNHAMAQQTAKPLDYWVMGDFYAYGSSSTVVAALNARSEYLFNKCKSRPTYECGKGIVTGPNGNRVLYNAIVNGSYINTYVDMITITETSDGKSSSTFTKNATSIIWHPICPDGYPPGNIVNKGVTSPDGALIYDYECIKRDPPPLDCPCNGAPGGKGNPVQIVDGMKTESQVDYVSADGLLEVKREFLGKDRGWYFPGESRLIDLHTNERAQAGYNQLTYYNLFNSTTGQPESGFENTPVEFTRSTASGQLIYLRNNGSFSVYPASTDPTPTFLTDVYGINIQKLAAVSPEGALWRKINPNGDVEEYDTKGHIRKKYKRDGRFVTYQYQGEQLTQMQDNWGKQISFEYDENGKMKKAVLPDGLSLSYSYQNGLLTQVKYQDNTTKQFLYNEPDNIGTAQAPYLLTGTVDENGARVGTYKYDGESKAISTESANGVNKYSFTFGYGYTQFVDPIGTMYTNYFTNANGNMALSRTNNPPGSGSSYSNQTYTYDPNGNIASSTDFKGTTTTYTYDLSRNLETKRIEAAGQPEAKTTSTVWHANYRIPVQIDEPLRRTTYTHDTKGNVLTKTEQATNDANGSTGAAATVVGTARVWSYTYNSVGQVLTATGPRNDVLDRTSYTYDSQGNLTSVTNGAGHVTTLSNYDPHGKVQTITDPNGVVTNLTYHVRGWLLSRAVTADGITETTSYDYDGVGQMTKVTMPDNSQITYVYDDAHRLTKISDHLGNSINYTLDNMGNRINETTTDATGALSRQVTRVYDQLNRLKEVTGAAQ